MTIIITCDLLTFEIKQLEILIKRIIIIIAIITNTMAYGTWRFNAAFTRTLQ